MDDYTANNMDNVDNIDNHIVDVDTDTDTDTNILPHPISFIKKISNNIDENQHIVINVWHYIMFIVLCVTSIIIFVEPNANNEFLAYYAISSSIIYIIIRSTAVYLIESSNTPLIHIILWSIIMLGLYSTMIFISNKI